MQIGVQDTWNDRNRRATPKLCSENPQGCCMEPLQVNFSRDFNWTWIIHPLTVDTFYCSGDCALGASAPDNNYVHLLQQKGLTPCCGVRKSKDLSIVYHHQDHQEQNDIIIQGKLDGLIVTDCGCSWFIQLFPTCTHEDDSIYSTSSPSLDCPSVLSQNIFVLPRKYMPINPLIKKLFENYPKCLIWILAFFTNFCQCLTAIWQFLGHF